jgi:hypothetical protein
MLPLSCDSPKVPAGLTALRKYAMLRIRQQGDGLMTQLSVLRDHRSDCFSVMTEMPIGEYINLVRVAHESQGALSGQRSVLGTATARRIRDRMVSDLAQGAVLPPVVIGVVLKMDDFNRVPEMNETLLSNLLNRVEQPDLSIIDGMQRTVALQAAVESESSVADRGIRVEFWFSRDVRALVYRMLVLNTGQVPWTLDRQISVVFASMLKELQARVPEIEKLISPDAPGRRVQAAQYRFDSIVEMYLAFSLRKTAVDTKEQVSDEFSRLDFVENVDDEHFQDQFYEALSMLVNLDKSFARAVGTGQDSLSQGRQIFDRQPARIGYVVALGLRIIGRPGQSKSAEEREAEMRRVAEQHKAFITKLSSMSPSDLLEFLRLDVLSEVLDRRSGQVGRYERAVFLEAFKVLLEAGFDVNSMEPCWRAN